MGPLRSLDRMRWNSLIKPKRRRSLMLNPGGVGSWIPGYMAMTAVSGTDMKKRGIRMKKKI